MSRMELIRIRVLLDEICNNVIDDDTHSVHSIRLVLRHCIGIMQAWNFPKDEGSQDDYVTS